MKIENCYSFVFYNFGGGAKIKEDITFECFNYYSTFVNSINSKLQKIGYDLTPFNSLDNIPALVNGTITQDERGVILIYDNNGAGGTGINAYNSAEIGVNDLNHRSGFTSICKVVAANPFLCKKIKITGSVFENIISNPDYEIEFFYKDVNGKEDTKIIVPSRYLSPKQTSTNIINLTDQNFLLSGFSGFRIPVKYNSLLQFDFFY